MSTTSPQVPLPPLSPTLPLLELFLLLLLLLLLLPSQSHAANDAHSSETMSLVLRPAG
jgi:hypothetical protein